MNKKSPLITVLMAVYNGEKYLREAIESILTQSYTDFEFLIINDGSSDRTEEIIVSYNDERIRYIKNDKNLKLIASLNKGLDLAKGEYIARMDADDISLPNRLEKQVKFMENNPEVGLLGTCVRTIGLEDNFDIKYMEGHDQIRLKLLFDNYITHPTVMLRSEILKKNNLKYPDLLHTEDYALWVLLSNYAKIEILPEILLHYRCHGNNISELHKDFQKKQTSIIRLQQLVSFGLRDNETSFQIFERFIDENTIENENDFKILMEYIEALIQKSKVQLNQDLLFSFFRSKLVDFMELNAHHMNKEIAIFNTSSFSGSKLQALKYILKSKLKISRLWN